MNEIIYAGRSELIGAGCTYHADEAFTLLIMCDDEPVSVEGYNSKAALQRVIDDARKNGTTVYGFFG